MHVNKPSSSQFCLKIIVNMYADATKQANLDKLKKNK